MENPLSNDQRLKFQGLVHSLPALAFACFAAFAAVPINAQTTDQCGFDTDSDSDIDDVDVDRQDVVFYEGDSNTIIELPNLITTDCEQPDFIQLRIYNGFDVGEPNSNIKLPETGDLNLGPTNDPDSVKLQVTGSHPDRTIPIDGADLTWDSSSTAWLIAPIEYTLRAHTVGNNNLASLKLTVLVLPRRLDPPTNVSVASESPSNIYVQWHGVVADTSGNYFSDYQVEWVPADGSGPAMLSKPIRDNQVDPSVDSERKQDYTISGLKSDTEYNIRIRSYKKTSTSQHNIYVSDWVEAVSDSNDYSLIPVEDFSNPVKTRALDEEGPPRVEGIPLRIPVGQTKRYNLGYWIDPIGFRLVTLSSISWTIDIESGNDAVFSVQHDSLGSGGSFIQNDGIIIAGVGEGDANLSIQVTTHNNHVLEAVIPVKVLENAIPVFSLTSVSVDWDIKNVGTMFTIDIANQYVSDAEDSGNLQYSLTGGSYQETTYLEINANTGDISIPASVTAADLQQLPKGYEFALSVTVTDTANQNDAMALYVEVIESFADVPSRTANSVDDVWLTPLSEANNGGSKTINVAGSFENRGGGQLCYEIAEEGFTVNSTDQTSNITIHNDSIDVDTVADFSLRGPISCPSGTLKVSMELPSFNPESDQLALLAYHGVITVWADVTAYPRGNKASASDDPVRVRIDLVYGANAAPIVRTGAKVTGGNTYYTTSAFSVDEGDDINLTFTADDPSPTGDRLCWSQRNNCTPCKGAEDTEVYNAARGGVVTEDRASDTVSNISHEYELTVRGTEHGIFGSNVPKVNTDYESNPGGYAINLCATDLAGETHKLKFVVKIENVEEAPVIVDIDNMYFLVGDYAQEIDLNELTVDGDGDADIVDFDADIVGSSTAVTVEESNGIVTVTPTEDDVSGTQTVEIEVSATDSSGTTAYQTFFAYVKNSNSSPSFGGLSAISYELEENAKVGTNVGTAIEATDPDADDTISYELSGGKDYFRVVTTDDGGQIKVKKKGLDYESDDNVFKLVLTASDNYGSAVALNITVTLLDVNEPPMATPDEIPDQRILVGVTDCIIKASEHFVDPDAGDNTPALEIEASSTRPGEVSVAVENNEEVCITGESVGSTPARITVTATDSDGTTVIKRFQTTAGQNNPPTVVGDGIPDQEVQFDGRSDDIDLDEYFNDGDAAYDEELTYGYSIADSTIVTAVIKEDHFLRIYGDEVGDTDITVTATDQYDQSETETLSVKVVRNNPPVPNAIANVNTRIGVTVDPIDASGAFTDDGDTFDLDISTSDTDVATTAVDYDDDDNPWINVYLHSTGVTKATLRATDTAGNSAEVSFTIDVSARNDPPKLLSEIDDVTVEVGDNVDVELDEIFEDEGNLTYEFDNEDESVAEVIYRSNNNTLRIRGNQVGTTDVTVTVSDNLDQTASDTFTVTVTDSSTDNSSPNLVAQIDDVTLQIGGESFVMDVDEYFIDEDGDELFYTFALEGNAAIATFDGPSLSLTPFAFGTTTVTVTATDTAGRSVSQSFNTIVSNSEIKAVGNEALSSVGRQMISSAAKTTDSRVENKETERNLFTRTRDLLSKTITPRNFTSMKLRDLLPENFSTSVTRPNARFSLSIWGTADQQDVSSSLYETSSSSTYVGVDIRPSNALMFGISLSENEAESDYSWGTAVRQLQTDTTTILPYASYQVTPRTLVWCTLGIGSGDASVWNGENLVDKSDLSVRLGHVAFKSHVLQMHGIDLSLKGDVSVASLSTDDGAGEAGSLDTTVDRLRFGVAGSYVLPLNWSGSVSPFGELAYRRDGGDGATGSGVEFIGGVRVASKMFSLDARGHTMTTYSENDYKESGITLLAVFNPTPGEQGLSFSFTPSWGQTTRMETSLWRESATVGQLPFSGGLGLSQGMTLNTNISYGFPINQDQHLFKPFIECGENAQNLRSIVFGAELNPVVISSTLFSMNFVLGTVNENSERKNKHLGVSLRLKY